MGITVGMITLVAILAVGFVISGAMRDTTTGTYAKANAVVNYATDFSADRQVNYTVSNAVYTSAGTVRVAYDNSTGVSNVTVGGTTTALATASPQTITVPASAIPEDGVVAIQYDMATNENVTDSNLTYTQFSGCQMDQYDLCEDANATMEMTASGFSVLPILVILFAAVAVISALVALTKA